MKKIREIVRNMTIRIKLVTLFSALIMFISIFIYVYFPSKYESFAESALQNKASSIAIAAAYSIAPGIIFNDVKSIDEVFDGVRQNKDLIYIVATDTKGNILSGYNKKSAFENNFRVINPETQGKNNIVKVSRPITQGNELYGNLYLALSTDEIRQNILISRQNVATISLLFLVIGLSIVIVISKIIANPIQVMLKTVQKIAQGDLSQRSVVLSNDEIGKLSSAFNGMVQNLETAYSELDDLNKNLEDKVDKRTEELKVQIQEKLKSEQKLLESEGRLQKSVERGSFLLQLYNDAPYLSDKQLYDHVLKQAVHLTDSQSGFLYLVSNNYLSINLIAVTDTSGFLSSAESVTTHAASEQGIWTECMSARTPLIKNEHFQPDSIVGLPDGYSAFERSIIVPALDEDTVVIVFIVNNKITDYDEQDVLQVQLVANEMYKILKQRHLDTLLRESEKKYKSIFDNVQDIFYQADTEGRILEISPSVEKYSGYTREELIGVPIDSLYANHEDRALLINLLLEKTEISDYTIKLRSKSGKIVYASINAHLLYDADNNMTGIEGALRDITERRLAEQEVEISKERFRQLFDDAPIGYYEINHEGRIINVNQTVFEMLGYSTGKLIGKYAWQIIENKEIAREEIIATLHGTKLQKRNYERNLLREDGTILPTLCEDKILISTSGNIIGMRTAFQDITRRKIIESELLAAKETAEESSRLKSSFLANMSHELRTPMIGILGFSEMLVEESADENVRGIAQIISKSGQRLMNTLNLILDLSRIEAGKLDLNITGVNIVPVIREVCTLFEETANKKGLKISLTTQHGALFLATDESVFREIVANLVNNGIKYTNQGSLTVDISTALQNKEQYVIIKVSDTGIGIASEDQKIIWDEFRQVSEGMGRSFEGTGLGLTITKKFVEKLKGEISVESELGKGSSFTIRLPQSAFTVPDDTVKQNRQSEILPYTEKKVEQKQFVLYVEDDTIAFDLVKRLLAKICEIDHVIDSTEALKKVHQKQYAAILMDINLGKGLDGLQTTKLIKQIDSYKEVPIIAITAYAMVGDKEEFLDAGCSHYISKPFEKSELISLMTGILGGAKI